MVAVHRGGRLPEGGLHAGEGIVFGKGNKGAEQLAAALANADVAHVL